MIDLEAKPEPLKAQRKLFNREGAPVFGRIWRGQPKSAISSTRSSKRCSTSNRANTQHCYLLQLSVKRLGGELVREAALTVYARKPASRKSTGQLARTGSPPFENAP